MLKIKGAIYRDAHTITAASAITDGRLVDSDLAEAGVDDLAVIGVAASEIASSGEGPVACHGLQGVVSDAPLAAKDPVKVGSDGRATKHTTAQHVVQTAIAGEATAFTQPGAASALEILQAADVEADRGRGIVIEGSDGDGDAITETITLDASDTTTVVAGTTEFTTISAVYTADGAVIGAQDVTIREIDDTGVCTLAGAASEIGADIPAQSQEAYCNEITVTGPNADGTFVTIVGINSAGAAARERLTLDAASPSKITSSTVFRYVERVCLGEFTNAGAGAVKTNSVTDTTAMKCGLVIEAATARGDEAKVLILPNA